MKMEMQITPRDKIKFPEILYKYRCWNNEYHKRFITEREVYLAAPNQFEDKLDCKIPIRYDLLTPQKAKEYCESIIKCSEPHLSRKQRRKKANLMAKTFKSKENNEEHQKHYFESFSKNMGILSLTAESHSDYMWKKYADNHKGFCIGYHSKILFKQLGGGGDVIYYDKMPVLLPVPINCDRKIIKSFCNQIYNKERKWECEKEYRTHKFFPGGASENDRRIKIPKDAFNSVILGKYMNNEDKEAIKNAIKKNGNIEIIE